MKHIYCPQASLREKKFVTKDPRRETVPSIFAGIEVCCMLVRELTWLKRFCTELPISLQRFRFVLLYLNCNCFG